MAIELCEHYMRPNRCAACLRARVATLEAALTACVRGIEKMRRPEGHCYACGQGTSGLPRADGRAFTHALRLARIALDQEEDEESDVKEEG